MPSPEKEETPDHLRSGQDDCILHEDSYHPEDELRKIGGGGLDSNLACPGWRRQALAIFQQLCAAFVMGDYPVVLSAHYPSCQFNLHRTRSVSRRICV